MKKLQKISSEYKFLRKLYPNMDRRKLKNNVYFYFSSKWRDFKAQHPNSLMTIL